LIGLDKKIIINLIFIFMLLSPCIVTVVLAVFVDFRKFIEKKEKSKDGPQ